MPIKDFDRTFKARRQKARRGDFNPDRAYVESAVNEYLKNGGAVTVIEEDENRMRNDLSGADFFLMGEHPARCKE